MHHSQTTQTDRNCQPQWTRREALRRGALFAAGSATALATSAPSVAAESVGKAVRNGRIKQSIAQWCFELFGGKWSLDRTCQVAKELGCQSVELLTAENFPTLKRHGLTCAMVQIDTNPDPPFLKGFNNPDHWPRLIKVTKEAIDAAAAFGAPNVICFTGYSAKDPSNANSPHIPRDEGARNCVEGLKQVVGYAEQKKVTLCLEMLNSREDTHPMKGHPGYQGDHTDYCIHDILRPVSSPRLKLLFDVYHVQIMDGDVIRRIRQQKEWLAHIHVAGNPGRGELDQTQEINYPPVMKALLEMGYQGFVGQEFIPTRDALQGLREAVTLCDV
jgi:hydroxypyruvate isomerase